MRTLDLGLKGYLETWDIQKEIHAAVAEGCEDCLIFVEHPPVLTLGANFHPENLRLTMPEYRSRGVQLLHTDRGGDVTYHGPGQLVIYPVFNLNKHGQDLHKWMRDLEETQMIVAKSFGLNPRRFAPHTGVWVDELKLSAIGVKIKQWVNLHGIALNCNVDIQMFELIIPCGIEGYGVTSLTQECGREITIDDVKDVMSEAFASVFAKTPLSTLG